MTDNLIGYNFLGLANRFVESVGFNFTKLHEVAIRAKAKDTENLDEKQLEMISDTIDSIIDTDVTAGRTKEGILEDLKTDKLCAIMFLIEVQSEALINLTKESVIIMQERGYIPMADTNGMISMEPPLESKLILPN
jgi:hypothetical protein